MELLVSGCEYQFTPTTVNIHFKSFIVQLVEIAFGDAEYIIQTITIGGESIWHQNLSFARLDDIVAADAALSLRSGDRIDARLMNGDDRRGFTGAPFDIRQVGDDLEGSAFFIAEVVSMRDDGGSSVYKNQMKGIYLIAAIGISMGM